MVCRAKQLGNIINASRETLDEDKVKMSRVRFAANILRELSFASILDVGCRDGALADELPWVEYAGADLYADKKGRVKYLGDICGVDIDRKFDVVAAFDVLEHLAHPSAAFDRLVELADKVVFVSFPNTYDLKGRFQYAVRGRLSGKYAFSEEEPRDRHHWVTGRSDILRFYEEKARKHCLALSVFDLRYGASGSRSFSGVLGRVAARLLPPSLATETVFGLFRR
jgi:2-polyprenyl-3-methyl-5-hydroxy-6-metoxy-1,4-benzoquinol methylase